MTNHLWQPPQGTNYHKQLRTERLAGSALGKMWLSYAFKWAKLHRTTLCWAGYVQEQASKNRPWEFNIHSFIYIDTCNSDTSNLCCNTKAFNKYVAKCRKTFGCEKSNKMWNNLWVRGSSFLASIFILADIAMNIADQIGPWGSFQVDCLKWWNSQN